MTRQTTVKRSASSVLMSIIHRARDDVHEADQAAHGEVDSSRDDDDRLGHSGEAEWQGADREGLEVEAERPLDRCASRAASRGARSRLDRPPAAGDAATQASPGQLRLQAGIAHAAASRDSSPCIACRSEPFVGGDAANSAVSLPRTASARGRRRAETR